MAFTALGDETVDPRRDNGQQYRAELEHHVVIAKDVVHFHRPMLVSELISNAFIREFYGIEYEFACREIRSAKTHRFL